jgi:mevalonate kinase
LAERYRTLIDRINELHQEASTFIRPADEMERRRILNELRASLENLKVEVSEVERLFNINIGDYDGFINYDEVISNATNAISFIEDR